MKDEYEFDYAQAKPNRFVRERKMPYYSTFEQDLTRAKLILQDDAWDLEVVKDIPPNVLKYLRNLRHGAISPANAYAAYKLLESLVAKVEELQAAIAPVTDLQYPVAENPQSRGGDRLYNAVRNICHSAGIDWVDPRSGVMYRAPEAAVAARCTEYRPDHNGECLNCDEPADVHDFPPDSKLGSEEWER